MFRLKELRMENGLKRSDFARELNLPASTIANYENETREAPYNILIFFADYFNVSIDYLLGRETTTNLYNDEPRFEGVLTNDEKKLISSFRETSGIGKGRILEYARLIKNADL